MRSRAFVVITGAIIGVILLSGACSAGFVAGRIFDPASVGITNVPAIFSTAEPVVGENSPSNTGELFAPFWQSWDLVHKEYVDQPVDDELLMRGAIRGMLEALGDPHTSYMEPEQYKQLNLQLQGDGSYEGIGAWVNPTAEYLTIISPIPGSPAEKAGLRTGDRIIAIDGEDMTGIDGELVRQRVLGPAGTQVTLTISRAEQEPFNVTIQRDEITVPSVDSRMLDGDIAYVRVLIFAANTKDQLRDALKIVLAQNPKGLVLDLRNNGGGYLESGIDVASEFIDRGVIVYEIYGDGRRTSYDARKGGLATDIPMVVLINQGSASASEIVAGAIQDLGRGKLVGATSFGKGSVQLPTELKNGEGMVRITIARWLTPNERTIHGIGLTPDVEVNVTEQDYAENRDPQLEKAVDLLSQ